MAGAIRLVSIERGHDPATFAAMPFGGGGALHIGALMEDVGLGAAIVPRYPGVTSALGCVVADMRQDRVQTVNRMLDDLDIAATDQAMGETADMLEAEISASGAVFDRIDRGFELDMLYLGQTHTVTVPLPEGALSRDGILAAFQAAYLGAYGRLLDGVPIRVMNTRVTVTGRRPPFDMRLFAPPDGVLADCQTGTRTIRANGQEAEAPIFDRLSLPEGARIEGPAILEQPDTTIFIDPGLVGQVDGLGNVIVRRAGESS